MLRVADKRNCANEPLKTLNRCGLHTMDQRMQNWTKAGPCPTTSHSSDGSERTHERGLDLGLQRRHLAPHWAKQKGQSSGIHWNPSQGPPNNHQPLTTLAIHSLDWYGKRMLASPYSSHHHSFIVLKAQNYSTSQSKNRISVVGRH